jgi:hypothetical protein
VNAVAAPRGWSPPRGRSTRALRRRGLTLRLCNGRNGAENGACIGCSVSARGHGPPPWSSFHHPVAGGRSIPSALCRQQRNPQRIRRYHYHHHRIPLTIPLFISRPLRVASFSAGPPAPSPARELPPPCAAASPRARDDDASPGPPPRRAPLRLRLHGRAPRRRLAGAAGRARRRRGRGRPESGARCRRERCGQGHGALGARGPTQRARVPR